MRYWLWLAGFSTRQVGSDEPYPAPQSVPSLGGRVVKLYPNREVITADTVDIHEEDSKCGHTQIDSD